MAIFKAGSVRFPLLIAVPALLVLGVAAVLLTGQDPPPPPRPPAANLPEPDQRPDPEPDSAPLQPDSDPPPPPRRGGPSSVAEAEEMAGEVWGALELIRSRLELRYKGADYQLDRGWTIEYLVRRLERLDGKHFRGSDFTLDFPEGEEPVAEIACVTRDGEALADGELKMVVDLRTGRTTKSGRVLARDPDGLILLGEREYTVLDSLLREAVYRHARKQLRRTDGALEPLEELFDSGPVEPFAAGDCAAISLPDKPLVVEFACRTLHGEQLAEPAVITLDYAAQSATISRAGARSWMPLPRDRGELKDDCFWYLRILAGGIRNALENGTPREQIRLEQFDEYPWAIRSAGILPFDVTLQISEQAPWVVTLEVATHFGRPLPFSPLKYVTSGDGRRDGWEDGD